MKLSSELFAKSKVFVGSTFVLLIFPFFSLLGLASQALGQKGERRVVGLLRLSFNRTVHIREKTARLPKRNSAKMLYAAPRY